MRNPPFSYEDKHPLRPVQRGGGECETDSDCGGDIIPLNDPDSGQLTNESNKSKSKGRGRCVEKVGKGMFGAASQPTASLPVMVCTCYAGFTGPHCLAVHHVDEAPSAFILRSAVSPFQRMHTFAMPGCLFGTIVALSIMLLSILVFRVREQTKERKPLLQFENGQPKPWIANSGNVLAPSSEIFVVSRASV
jgi:hypothetical protein